MPIKTVGAWVTKSGLTDPAATVAGLERSGANSASIMLNDYRVSETPAPFRTHDPAKVIALADACHDAGIEVGLTTWVMADREFIEGMHQQLIPLLEATRSSLLTLDAEEVWVRGDGDMTHDAAASLIGELLAGVPMGLTGIVFANTAALMGLSAVCATWMPQCYATTNAGSMDPERAVDRGISEWTKRFGDHDDWIIGAAAYAQPPDPADYMQPVIDSVLAHGLSRVYYWSHGWINKRADVAEFIAGIIEDIPTAGIFMPLDVASMSTQRPLPESAGVALVQGELVAWSVIDGDPALHPGPVDGLPGGGTLAAVEAFQRARGLPPTGVVDVPTWTAMSLV